MKQKNSNTFDSALSKGAASMMIRHETRRGRVLTYGRQQLGPMCASSDGARVRALLARHRPFRARASARRRGPLRNGAPAPGATGRRRRRFHRRRRPAVSICSSSPKPRALISAQLRLLFVLTPLPDGSSSSWRCSRGELQHPIWALQWTRRARYPLPTTTTAALRRHSVYCAKIAPGEERNWPILRRSKPWIIKLPAPRSREGAHCGGRARDHHPPSPRLELRQPLRANLVEDAVAAVLAAHLATRVEVVEEAAAWGVRVVGRGAGGVRAGGRGPR